MTIEIRDKDNVTSTEARKIFVDIFEQFAPILNKYLGENEYACYINIVWDKPIEKQPNTYHSIHALTHPENEEKTKEVVDYLSTSLYGDPFVTGSVLHHTVSNFLENNYTVSLEETDNKFKVTGDDPKGVN